MTNKIRTLENRRPGREKSNVYVSSAVLILLAAPGLAFSDWEFDPVVRVAADFDDNASLTTRTDDKDSISGVIGEARVQIVRQTDTGRFTIEPILRSRLYKGDVDRDANDQFLNIRMQHNGKSNTFGLRGNYDRESVRTAELADADVDADLIGGTGGDPDGGIDPDEIEDDDTGNINLDQRRQKLRLVPRWSANLSDVSKIVADMNFLTVDYDSVGNQPNELVDYIDTRIRLSYERNFSPRNTSVLTATARKYQSDALNADIVGYGLSAGFNRSLSETAILRARVGVETNDQFDGSNEPEAVADVSLVRRQKTTNFLAQYRRRISASGRGRLVERNEVNLRFARDLTDKLSAGIGARAFRSTPVSASGNETEYVQLNLQVVWRLTQVLSIQTNYRYTVIDRSDLSSGESANSNRFTLWFSYQPKSQANTLFKL